MENARSNGVVAGQLGSLYSLGAAGSLSDGQLLERFLARDDPMASEAAFTALVDRHGAMVLSVCRGELGDVHDAHDAFQATFLVLVSKAASIRRRDSVGGWLLSIARRVATRARLVSARRRRRLEHWDIERMLVEDNSAATMPAETEPDYAPLIAEVDRLPERFRAAVVLHYFEGLSTEATAQRLGCARGTVLSRLSRARNRIKQRLEQQGVSYPALIPAGVPMIRWLPPTPVPSWLAHGTIRAASSLGLAGAAVESVVCANVAWLSRRVTRTLAPLACRRSRLRDRPCGSRRLDRIGGYPQPGRGDSGRPGHGTASRFARERTDASRQTTGESRARRRAGPGARSGRQTGEGRRHLAGRPRSTCGWFRRSRTGRDRRSRWPLRVHGTQDERRASAWPAGQSAAESRRRCHDVRIRAGLGSHRSPEDGRGDRPPAPS